MHAKCRDATPYALGFQRPNSTHRVLCSTRSAPLSSSAPPPLLLNLLCSATRSSLHLLFSSISSAPVPHALSTLRENRRSLLLGAIRSKGRKEGTEKLEQADRRRRAVEEVAALRAAEQQAMSALPSFGTTISYWVPSFMPPRIPIEDCYPPAFRPPRGPPSPPGGDYSPPLELPSLEALEMLINGELPTGSHSQCNRHPPMPPYASLHSPTRPRGIVCAIHSGDLLVDGEESASIFGRLLRPPSPEPSSTACSQHGSEGEGEMAEDQAPRVTSWVPPPTPTWEPPPPPPPPPPSTATLPLPSVHAEDKTLREPL